MATKLGTCVKITLDAKELVGELSSSLTTGSANIEVSSKASCRATNLEYGRINESVSVSSIATTDGAATEQNWKDLHEMVKTATKVPVVITEYDDAGAEVVGALNISGIAVISNLTFDTPDNDRLTFSCDLSFDGDIDVKVNPVP